MPEGLTTCAGIAQRSNICRRITSRLRAAGVYDAAQEHSLSQRHFSAPVLKAPVARKDREGQQSQAYFTRLCSGGCRRKDVCGYAMNGAHCRRVCKAQECAERRMLGASSLLSRACLRPTAATLCTHISIAHTPVRCEEQLKHANRQVQAHSQSNQVERDAICSEPCVINDTICRPMLPICGENCWARPDAAVWASHLHTVEQQMMTQ